jgi:hypothetical protein
MRYIYYVNGKKFTTDFYYRVPWGEVSSYSENTPAYEDTLTGEKLWCEIRDRWHRLTGPSYINEDGIKRFCLNGKHYKNVHDWLKDHPNQTNAFQVEMLLKYT